MNWKNVILWAPVALLAIGLITWLIYDHKTGNGSNGAPANGESDSTSANEHKN